MDDILEKANIPKEAKLAFEGTRCRVYQWQQTLYDGSVATFEKLVQIPAATVIAVIDGKILIQEQEQPHLKNSFLSLAGGHADDWNEPLLEVAKRELLEEAGLQSDEWQLFTDLTRWDFRVFNHHLYLANNCMKVAEPRLDSGEKVKGEFVSIDEFRVIIEDPKWRHLDITSYLNKPGNFDRLITSINS